MMMRNSKRGWASPLRLSGGLAFLWALLLSPALTVLSGCEPAISRDNPWDPGSDGFVDADEDRFPEAEDCDDTNADVFPGQAERCNSLDDNCDGETDEGLTVSTYYQDSDGDDFGSSVTISACGEAPAGYTSRAGDCDDSKSSINPIAEDFCDGIDQNCDDDPDNDAEFLTYYEDRDEDGFGDPDRDHESCDPQEAQDEGWVENGDDCNDSDDTVYPDAPEKCNDIDDDCDGLPDSQEPDATPKQTLYPDLDVDQYGDKDATPIQACPQAGYAAAAGDCNDADNTVYPTAPELCDLQDNDCDGSIDEGLTQNTYFRDADSDGYGLTKSTLKACTAPKGYTALAGDCDDSEPTVYPYAPELCDGLDNNCNEQVDEGLSRQKYYPDTDGDQYGDEAFASAPTEFCGPTDGYSPNATDCDDTDATIHPAANERFNAQDDNCDGLKDNQIPALEEFDLQLRPSGVAEGARTVGVVSSDELGLLSSLGSVATPNGAVLWEVADSSSGLVSRQVASFGLGDAGVGTQLAFARLQSRAQEDIVLGGYNTAKARAWVQVYLNSGEGFSGDLSSDSAVFFESTELNAPLDGLATLELDGDGIEELVLACSECVPDDGAPAEQGMVLVLSLALDASVEPPVYKWTERLRVRGHDVGIVAGQALATNGQKLLATTLGIDGSNFQEVRVLNLEDLSGEVYTKGDGLLYTLTLDSSGISNELALTELGMSLAFANDLNQNLEPELVLSAATSNGVNAVGVVDIHSSYTEGGLYAAGAVLLGTAQAVELSSTFSVVADLTNDGVPDLLLSSKRISSSPAAVDVHLLSGATLPAANSVRDMVDEQLASFSFSGGILGDDTGVTTTGLNLSLFKLGPVLCAPGYEDADGLGFVGFFLSPYPTP